MAEIRDALAGGDIRGVLAELLAEIDALEAELRKARALAAVEGRLW